MKTRLAVHRRLPARALCVGIALLLADSALKADTFTWTGGAGLNWNNAANWTEGVPASAADTALVFDNIAGQTLNNDLPGGLTLNSIELGVNTGGSIFNGNALTFDGANAQLLKDTTSGEVRFNTAFVLNTDLTVSAFATFSSQLRLAGAISGAGGLHFFDGVNIVQGANTFIGATLVSGGTLGVSGSGLAATSGITLETGADMQVLRVNSTTATNINRALTLGGRLIASSRNISVLGFPAPAAIYSGAITLSGDAEILAFNGIGTGFNAVEFSVTGPVDLAGHTLLIRAGGQFDTVNMSGSFTGAGNLDVRPNNGTIVLPAITGNRDVLISSTGAGSATIASLSGDGLLDVNYAGATFISTATVTGAVGGTRAMTVRGGVLTLSSAASTFTGTPEASGNGVLSVANSDRLGNAANTVALRDGGGLRLTSGGAFPRAIALTNGGALLGSGLQTISGDITGTGGLNVAQTQWTLTGNNTFTGGLRITTCTVIYNDDTNLGAPGGIIRLEGGQLNLPAALTVFPRPIETMLPGQPGILSAALGQNVTISGDITGAGSMRFDNRGAWTLTGNNTFEGGLIVLGSGGLPTTIVAASENNLGGANSPITFGNEVGITVRPAALLASGDISIPATRPTAFRALTVDTAGHTVIFNQPLTGRGLTKTGDGLFVLGGTITPTSGFGNTISIQQGTLRTGAAGVIPDTTGVTVGAGALFDLDGHNQSISGISAEGDVSLGSGSLTMKGGFIEGVVSGTGGLTVTTGGNLELLGANTFSGGISVIGGAELAVASTGGFGAEGNAVLLDNGGLRTHFTAPAPVVLDAATNLTIGPGGAKFSAVGKSLIIAAPLTGSAPLNFSGGSPIAHPDIYEVRLAHPTNTFSGNIQLGDSGFTGFGDATLGIVADGSLGDAANVLTLGDSFFDGETFRASTGTIRAFADITFPATRAIRLRSNDGDGGGAFDTNGHTITVNTAITQLDPGSPLRIGGGGAVLFNAANTYTGDTLVTGGTTLGGSGSILSATLTGGSTLNPGNSAGLFFIAGNLDIYGASTLAFEIGGTARGVDYDALDVGGSVFLNAGHEIQLAITLTGGFENSALLTDTFTLVITDGLSGEFANVANGARLETTDGLGSFLVHYGPGSAFGPNNIALSDFIAVPEPGSALLILGGAALLARRKSSAAPGTSRC